jgi:hypothetical protein
LEDLDLEFITLAREPFSLKLSGHKVGRAATICPPGKFTFYLLLKRYYFRSVGWQS